MSESEIRTVFAENLRKMLMLKGHTQSEMYKYMGVSSATASDWCKGKKIPRMDKIELLCQFLNCNKSDLLMSNDEASSCQANIVPLLGGMAAGIGSNMAILDNIEKPAFVNADCAFVVRGESMASCGIHTDDIVYIKRGIYQDGTIHCVRTPDGYVLKKLYRSNNGFMLLSDIEPIIVDGEQTDYEVVGKAVYKLQAI